ncbi:MAG: M56 family metallopeptidase [Bacteroidota bacterium]
MTPTFVLAMLIKGLLVLSIALGLSLLFRRASAAVRHGVWVAAFVALLALPVLEAMGPKWSIPMGHAPSVIEGVLAPTPAVPPVPPVPALLPDASVLALERHAAEVERHAAEMERQAERLAAQAAREVQMEIHLMERQLEQAVIANRAVQLSGGSGASIVLASAPASVVQTVRSVPREVVLAILWFWGLGALAVGLMWATAYAAAARAVRLGTPETNEDRLETWERIRLLSGVTRPVRLLRSPALDVPIAWGWGDAAVVLPESADGWDDDRMEAVLLHELAHVIRGDAFSQLIAQIALVLHWANPLAWLAYRNFLLEREHACDDVVLEHGARPSTYADHLVQVARDLRRRSAALAAVAPMARHSNLEGRVRSILDPAQKRATLSRTAGATLMLLLCALAMPVAALQPIASSDDCDPCEVAPVVAEPVTAAIAPIAPPTPAPAAVPEPDPLALEIEEAVAAVDAIELAMQSPLAYPLDLRLALDTIPRFEDVIRPALEGALNAIEAMRDSERRGNVTLSDDDWEEMEEEIREAIEDARENYDEAIQEAIDDALDGLDDDAWEVSWSDQPDGAQVSGYTSEAALRRARQDVEHAQRDAQRALEEAQRSIQHQLRDAEHHRRIRQRNQQRAAEDRARMEQHVRAEARARTRNNVRVDRRSNGQGYSYSYSVSDDGSVTVQSSNASGWASGLDGLDHGLDNIERSLSQLEHGSAHPSALAGLSAGLSGIRNGLVSISGAAQTWDGSSADKRAVKERVQSTRDRLDALQERLDDCND